MEEHKYNNKRRLNEDGNNAIYSKSQITKIVVLPFTAIGANLATVLGQTVSTMVEGKCIVEGYVKQGSVEVITYSSGLLKGSNVVFEVVFTCYICHPVAGLKLDCVAVEITKGGIRAKSADQDPSPFVLYIARDHAILNKDEQFNKIHEDDRFTAVVIDYRFELNDKYISIIGEIKQPTANKKMKTGGDTHPALVFSD